MLASGVLNLPDSFALGVILAVVLLITLAIRLRQREAKKKAIQLLVLFAATIICLGYASVTYVPKDKVATLTNLNGHDGVLEHGLQFKPPWDDTNTYDDVIIAEEDHSTWSLATHRGVGRSYLMAHSCVRTFRELIKAGQSDASELTCTFDGTSLLVVRE